MATGIADHGGNEMTEWYSDVPRGVRNYTVIGMVFVGLAFGLGGTWALTAPLAAAIIAQGSFVATGSNKVIQHLEGGVIEKLYVNEGDRVKAGDELVALDRTSAETNERALRLRLLRLETIVARLQAQADGKEEFVLPANVTAAAGDPDVTSIIQGQRVVFTSKLVRMRDQLNLISKNISALEFRRSGYDGQLQAFVNQKAILQEEFAGKQKLFKIGAISKLQLLNIQRSMADAEGDIAQLQAQKDESRAQIEKFRQDAIIAQNTNRQEALDALETAKADLESVRQEMRAASGVLGRMAIRSPVSGVVVRTYYNSSGGVVTTGKPIMEILPDKVPLIIEARIARSSIDQVSDGQKVAIRLTTVNSRTTPVIEGEVFYVSADSVEDGNRANQKDVYIIRVEVPDEQLAPLHDFRPVPGMPAEVLIQTAERTFFEYLTKPITDSMSRAFRER